MEILLVIIGFIGIIAYNINELCIKAGTNVIELEVLFERDRLELVRRLARRGRKVLH